MKRGRKRGADFGALAGAGSGSRRSERVAAEIQRLIGQVLVQDVRDERAAAANVTRVKVTPDLRLARVYFALLTKDPGDPEEARAALSRAAPYLRRRIAQDLGMRYTPDLEFFFDEQLADARRIDSLLRDLHDEPGDESDDGPGEPGATEE